MRLHLIHHPAPRHAAALPGLLPDHGPAPLPRERASWRSILHLLLFLAGVDAGEQPEDGAAPPARSAVALPAVAPATAARPAHAWPHPHVPHPHLPGLPALAGRILHRGPRAAAAPGLSLAAVPLVPTVPTAAGPTGNALGVPLYGASLVPSGRYLPGEDPRTTTQQLHALHEGALAALDLHYAAIRKSSVELDALALSPLPSDAPTVVEPTTAHGGSCCCEHCESEAYKDHDRAHAAPPVPDRYEFAAGTHRRVGDVGFRVPELARAAAPPPGRHVAGSAAARYVIGGAR